VSWPTAVRPCCRAPRTTSSSIGRAFAYLGVTETATTTVEQAIKVAADLGGILEHMPYWGLALAALAAGDVATSRAATETAWQYTRDQPSVTPTDLMAEAALAAGDVSAARDWADLAIASADHLHYRAVLAFLASARVAAASHDPDRADHDAHQALARAGPDSYLAIPDVLECVADLMHTDDPDAAARIFGAADGIRHRMGAARFALYNPGWEAAVSASG
jgi:thioredoxin-like negative regulator of GroEL